VSEKLKHDAKKNLFFSGERFKIFRADEVLSGFDLSKTDDASPSYDN